MLLPTGLCHLTAVMQLLIVALRKKQLEISWSVKARRDRTFIKAYVQHL